MPDATPVTVLIANPSADTYGSDLQMLQSVRGLRRAGHRVLVAMPDDGALVPLLREAGAEVRFVPFPVVRRSSTSLGPFVAMVLAAALAVPRLAWLVRRFGVDVVYVNTVTIPWWLLAARLAGRPAVCHVHEAENQDSRPVRLALTLPLLLAHATLIISRATMTAMCEVVPRLRGRAHLVFNGVPDLPEPPEPPVFPTGSDEPWHAVIVARLSPRKAPHVALETVAELRRQGRPVTLELCGTAFEGYEDYEAELRARAEEPDLAGAVTFAGYTSPVWPALARAHLMLAPSLREPFGNAVVESQLAMRPVVAAAALGHLETVIDGETGLLVPPDDAPAMARATARLMDDPDLASAIARQGRERAIERFSVARYDREVVGLLTGLAAGDRPSTARTPQG